VKWTTAIQVAEHAVALCARRLGAPRSSARASLVGADGAEGVASDRLASLYGADRDVVGKIASESPELAVPLAEGVETIGAEVAFAIRVELARHLDDVVMRRTGLGAAGHPGEAALSAAGRIAARELGWSEARERDEIAAVERRFPER
jgi:glycerol-3-phosphate dehydrogenase